MKENYFLGVYWGARKENLDECSDKIFKTFEFIKQMDESFALWYDTDKPKKGIVISPIDLTKYSLNSLLIKGQNYNDEYKLQEELGYQIYLKSGINYSKAHVISITCGSYSSITESIPNNINITIKAANIIGQLYPRDLEAIYNFFYTIWHAERGVMKIDT